MHQRWRRSGVPPFASTDPEMFPIRSITVSDLGLIDVEDEAGDGTPLPQPTGAPMQPPSDAEIRKPAGHARDAAHEDVATKSFRDFQVRIEECQKTKVTIDGVTSSKIVGSGTSLCKPNVGG